MPKKSLADSDCGECRHRLFMRRMVRADESADFVSSAFWSFNEWSKGLETETGSVIGADGSLFAIWRCLHRPAPGETTSMYRSTSCWPDIVSFRPLIYECAKLTRPSRRRASSQGAYRDPGHAGSILRYGLDCGARMLGTFINTAGTVCCARSVVIS
jgi:hypothetical protein